MTVASIICAISLSLTMSSAAAPLSEEPAALAKVHPWVLDRTENGAEAEFLAVLADQADLSGASDFSTRLEKGWFVYETLLLKARSTQKPLLELLSRRGVPHRSFYIVNLIWVKGGRELALELADRPEVGRVEGNPEIRQALPCPFKDCGEKASAGIETNIAYVRADQVWAMGYTGQGVVVGGQDTGYEWDHPALIGKYRGWNGQTASHDYNWHDAVHSGGGACGPDSPEPCDDHGHGTHTMGTVLGDDGGSNQIGMAPGTKWIGCRNMDEGVGTPATYLECFEFFLAPYPVGGTPDQGDPGLAPDVTNNSWGCPPDEGCSSDTLLSAVRAQRAAGIFTAVSAGNSGPACSTVEDPPATYDESYSVGALLKGTDTAASFSSRGPVAADGSGRRKPDLAAPGTGIRSSLPGGDYGSMSGTSMAAPHVAGAVALLWSARPELKNRIEATETVLNASAFHLASTACDSSGWPNHTYGYGRLDVRAAVDYRPSRRWIRDYDGDGTSDIAVFRGNEALWAARGITRAYFGTPGDLPVPGDYDGNGTTDFAVFRESSGLWAVRGVSRFYFGLASDLPLPGDYNGDGAAEAGVFRPGEGLWALRGVTRVYFGLSDDTAVPGYYDEDGTMEIGIFRPASALWALRGVTRVRLGNSASKGVPGDYDADGIWEPAVFNGTDGAWTAGGVTRFYFGQISDRPLPADYRGSGVDEAGIFRDASGLWSARNLTLFYFGTTGDRPVTR